MRREKLLFVIQRFGDDVDGGAELYCRWLAEKISALYDLTVATTCAQSYITWENHYPPGETVVNDYRILRFKTEKTREIETFNQFTGRILSDPKDINFQTQWLIEQGPYAPDLITYLSEHHHEYDFLFFFTYLYYPTVLGIQIAPEKSFLIPTAHEEPVATLPIFRDVFEKNAGLLFLTPSEKLFVEKRFDVSSQPGILLGTGINLPTTSLTFDDIQRKHQIHDRYLIYMGRVEAGKGCSELIDFFLHYRHVYASDMQLVLAGRNHLGRMDLPGVRFTDFVPEDDVKPLLENAFAVVVPSPFESLSILLLQGMKLSRPIMANGRSAVLKAHCEMSNAGLFYLSRNEFSRSLQLLENRPDICQKLGKNGERYIKDYYSWDVLLHRFRAFLNDRHHNLNH